MGALKAGQSSASGLATGSQENRAAPEPSVGRIPSREFCSRSPGHNGHPASCMTTSPGGAGGAQAGHWEDSQARETKTCGGSMAAQPRTALGTIPGTACLRMVTFSTPVSAYPSLVGPEQAQRCREMAETPWAQQILGSASLTMSTQYSGTSFPGEKTKSQGNRQHVYLGRQGPRKILHSLY